ncbi:hypothetical protein MHYP_G00018520 [Metynnis hypsauchen]
MWIGCISTQRLTASRGNPVTPRTKPSSEHHANLQADWQWRAASLPAPLSGSPRRNLKPPSLTPRHPFDHRLLIGRPPSSQASLPGRQETEVGYQLRRLACLKPHQDIWDRPWKPQREPTGSQARFPSLGFKSGFSTSK